MTTHPYWVSFREVAARAGVRACWSEPIISSTNEVLGTFAIYYRNPHGPDEADLEMIRSAASLAGIAIEHKRSEAELKESHQRLRVADRLAALGTLTAGLGHDMNNVLFPIRCRLGAVDWKKVPPDLKDLLVSSRTTVNYLQQLCNGLRLGEEIGTHGVGVGKEIFSPPKIAPKKEVEDAFIDGLFQRLQTAKIGGRLGQGAGQHNDFF